MKMILFFFTTIMAFFNTFLEEESKITIPEDVITMHYKYVFEFINGDLLYCDSKMNDSCNITLNDMQNEKQFVINIPDTVLDSEYACNLWNITDIKYNNKKLFIALRGKIMILNYFANIFQLEKVLNINSILKEDLEPVTRIKIIDNKIIGVLDRYYDINTNQPYCFVIDLLDPTNNQTLKFREPKGYYWKLFRPRVCLDAGTREILESDITDYNIRIYDYDGVIKDSLKRVPKGWKQNLTDLEIPEDTDPRRTIYNLQNDTVTTSLMHKAQFVNDSTILVCYSIDDGDEESEYLYHFYYDVWRKKNNKWYLSVADFDSEAFDHKNQKNSDAPIHNGYLIIDNKIVSFHPDFSSIEDSFIMIRQMKEE